MTLTGRFLWSRDEQSDLQPTPKRTVGDHKPNALRTRLDFLAGIPLPAHVNASLCRPTPGQPWSVDDSHWHLPSRRFRLAEPKFVRKCTATGPHGSVDLLRPTSHCSTSLRLSPPPVSNFCAIS